MIHALLSLPAEIYWANSLTDWFCREKSKVGRDMLGLGSWKREGRTRLMIPRANAERDEPALISGTRRISMNKMKMTTRGLIPVIISAPRYDGTSQRTQVRSILMVNSTGHV